MNKMNVIRSLIPEMNSLLHIRLMIVHAIADQQPIGRQALAQVVDLTERITRSHVDVLKSQGIIHSTQRGMSLTQLGQVVYQAATEYIGSDDELERVQLQERLKAHLNINHCVVVPGDADETDNVYVSLGQEVNKILADFLPQGDNTIAMTGGSTLARVASQLDRSVSQNRQLTFVPSRGGMGSDIGIQSNSVGNEMAQRTGGTYLPLFIPESLAQETTETLMKDANIARIINMSTRANCLILSVGTAKVMAERRNMTNDQYQIISRKKAVGEAFGAFFNGRGDIVMSYPRIGLRIKDLEQIPLLITVVGGSSKAEAVIGFFKLAPSHTWLVCDEGIAKSILSRETY